MSTLTEIAKEAGCSVATASRALSGNPKISAVTRQRVEEVASCLGYQSKSVKQRVDRSRTIGIVIPSVRKSHFDASLLHDVLARDDLRVILCCHDNSPTRDSRILQSLLDYQVDGIIHTPCTVRGAESFFKGGCPVPVVELGIQPSSQKADIVSMDEEAGIREIVEYLVGLGHKRIVLFTGRKELFHVQFRSSAFRLAIEKADLEEKDCPVIYGPATVQWFRDSMSALIRRSNRPTAVLLGNRLSAIGVLLALGDAEIRVPQDISLVGFSSEDWFAITNPPITTYEHPMREMGMVAAELLTNRLNSQEDDELEPRVVRFTGQLITRQSTGRASDYASSLLPRSKLIQKKGELINDADIR